MLVWLVHGIGIARRDGVIREVAAVGLQALQAWIERYAGGEDRDEVVRPIQRLAMQDAAKRNAFSSFSAAC